MELHAYGWAADLERREYGREIECQFQRGDSCDDTGGEYLKFRLNVEFDREPSDEECLRAALVAAQQVIAAELAKQGG